MRNSLLSFAVAVATLVAGHATAAPPMFAATAQSAAAINVTPAFLFGRWTDDGDCNKFIDFHADGRFTTVAGSGQWSLANRRLTFTAARTISAQISAPSVNRIVLTHDDGTVGESTRCTPPPRSFAMPPRPASIPAALAMSQPGNRQMLIGTWTDTGDCTDVVTFFANGRFAVANAGGTWTVANDRLILQGGNTVSARLRAVGANRILLIHDDGTIGQSVRC